MRHQANFLKICFPPSLGSIILPTAPSNFFSKSYFLAAEPSLLWPLNASLPCQFLIQNPHWKSKWGICWAPFAILLSIACILDSICTFPPCFCPHFAEKVDFALRCHIALIREACTACKICRIHVAWCPLLRISDFDLHAFTRQPAAVCRAWIEGRRCALPRGPSIF